MLIMLYIVFGLTVDKVQSLYNGGYNPFSVYEGNQELHDVLNLLRDGYFSHGDAHLFKPLFDHLIYNDDYFVLADYESYIECQESVSNTWKKSNEWARMAITNTSRMGYFSSDRSIEEYCDILWNVKPFAVDIEKLT